MAEKDGGVPIHLNKDMFIYNDTVSEKLFLACFDTPYTCTVNPLYNDIRYNSKIRYNVNSVCTKISGSCIFSFIFPCYSSEKNIRFVYLLESPRRGDSN